MAAYPLMGRLSPLVHFPARPADCQQAHTAAFATDNTCRGSACSSATPDALAGRLCACLSLSLSLFHKNASPDAGDGSVGCYQLL